MESGYFHVKVCSICYFFLDLFMCLCFWTHPFCQWPQNGSTKKGVQWWPLSSVTESRIELDFLALRSSGQVLNNWKKDFPRKNSFDVWELEDLLIAGRLNSYVTWDWRAGGSRIDDWICDKLQHSNFKFKVIHLYLQGWRQIVCKLQKSLELYVSRRHAFR